MYSEVNDMLGDIVKVTPSSKMVGDLAIFMVQNKLDRENLLERGKALTFPESVVSYFKGMMGQPAWGFPEDLQKVVLKGEEPITCRPGELLAPGRLRKALGKSCRRSTPMPVCARPLPTACIPRWWRTSWPDRKDVRRHQRRCLRTCSSTAGPRREHEINIEDGKTLVIKYLGLGERNEDGTRNVQFELNGMRRDVRRAP